MREFDNAKLSVSEAQKALDDAIRLVKQNLPLFTNQCQNHSSVHNVYPPCDNVQWTCGFWPGEVWLAWENSKEPAFLETANTLVESFYDRIQKKIEVEHHDMGFLYSPSCVSAWKLTGNERAKEAALLAADNLVDRFQEKGEFIQAWGKLGTAENYRFIIDCLMNLPLLYWAAQETGQEKYAAIARRHLKTCLRYSIRPDGSTYHTFYMDTETGEPVSGVTCQGYRNDSCWARGQAWGVYGTALSYGYTQDEACLQAFNKVLDYYLEGVPEDLVPYWDMIFNEESGEPRDSSSTAIVVCGLLEMAKHTDESRAKQLRQLASQMLKSLVDKYAIHDGPAGSGLVKHGTYSKKSPYNTCIEEGVDECVSWGDYFYMEALTRFLKDWNLYW